MPKALIRGIALASPIIWFLNLLAQFALAPLACVWRSNLILLILSLCALALDAGCGFTAWNVSQETEHLIMPRWLALSGVVLSGGFFLVIIAQALPSIFMAGCV